MTNDKSHSDPSHPISSADTALPLVADQDTTRLPTNAHSTSAGSAPSREPEVVFYTVAEMAALLKVAPCTVYGMVSRGLLKRARGLRHLRITARSFKQYQKLSDSDDYLNG
jgi:hypothetical protein